METFQPEGGGEKKRGEERGEGGKPGNEVILDCQTDGCSRTEAGGVSSAGGAGVGLVSLAFPGLSALHAGPLQSRTPQRNTMGGPL